MEVCARCSLRERDDLGEARLRLVQSTIRFGFFGQQSPVFMFPCIG